MNADLHPQWNYRTPRLIMLLVEVLASIMGLAVTVMTLSQVRLLARSSVEACQTDVDYSPTASPRHPGSDQRRSERQQYVFDRVLCMLS